MLRKYCIVLIIFSLVCLFNACSTNEQIETEENTEAVPEQTASEIVPGEMVLIPAGEFILGSEDKDSFTYYPTRKMDISAFWIDKYEVTNMEFLDFTIESDYSGENIQGKTWRLFFSSPNKANTPAILTWNDAAAYCKFKGKRLPTEFEWEKAARGTEGFKYPWGNEWESGRSNTYEQPPLEPANIGQLDDVSPYGVHDMLGNVQDWTSSEYKPYKGNPKKDPNARPGMRVVRGLGSRHQGKKASIYERSALPPSSLFDFGCRCARDATPEEIEEAMKTQQ
jgi:formylglycine-generating enzyme required for sulfatase activity